MRDIYITRKSAEDWQEALRRPECTGNDLRHEPFRSLELLRFRWIHQRPHLPVMHWKPSCVQVVSIKSVTSEAADMARSGLSGQERQLCSAATLDAAGHCLCELHIPHTLLKGCPTYAALSSDGSHKLLFYLQASECYTHHHACICHTVYRLTILVAHCKFAQHHDMHIVIPP